MTNMIFYCLFCPITGAKAAITWSAPGWNHMTTPILQSYELDLFCSGGADSGPRGRPVAAWVKKYLTSENSKWSAPRLQLHEARRAAIIWRRHWLKSHEACHFGITWERAAVHMIKASLYTKGEPTRARQGVNRQKGNRQGEDKEEIGKRETDKGRTRRK